MPNPQKKDVEDLINDLHLAAGNPAARNWGNAVFLIGAGCSYSAGIPLAGEIARQCAIDLSSKYSAGKFKTEDAVAALNWLIERQKFKPALDSTEPEWGKLYGRIFQEHFKADPQQRDIILKAIDKSEGKINWAHVCLGELVNRGYIHTVLTTNFDQLVLQGIIRTGLLPVIADGIESLTRISSRPQHPQVVYLHGSMHTYSPRNSLRAVKETREDLSFEGTLYNLVKDCSMLVVIGYGGGEEGVMDLLKDAARQFQNLVIYWVMHEESFELLSNPAKELLEIGNNKFFIPNYDADNLFAEIMEGLGIGVPEWMEHPASNLFEQAQSFAPSQSQDIRIKIKTYQTKVQQLKEPLSETDDGTVSPLDRIATLRLEGRHVEALELLRQMETSAEPDIWRIRAESAYEAGQLSSEQTLLLESIAAWKRVLKLVSKKDDPRLWYASQIGLGKAFLFLSELVPNKQHLQDAVSAYAAASEKGSRKIAPSDWANAQNNLGIALQQLGEMEHSLTHLRRAVKAHRAALSEYDRRDMPLDWAETYSNLGGALQTLGELKKDPSLLEEAAAAYRTALKEYTHNRVPLDWAETQSNLGGALQVLGDFKEDPLLWEEAAAAYRASLEVPSNEITGVNRAEAQSGLGDTLFKLGKHNDDVSLLQEALTAYQESVEFYRKLRDTGEVQVIEEKLQQAEKLIKDLEVVQNDCK
jgi:tetratricopeptide (TPR) repeat protein